MRVYVTDHDGKEHELEALRLAGNGSYPRLGIAD